MWQVGATCYSSPLAANQAAASAQVGAVVPHGGVAHVVSVSAVDASSITYSLLPVGGGSTSSMVVPANPLPCGLLTHVDGIDLSWKVAAVWIAAWSIVFLAKSAWRVLNGGDGDT